MAKNVLNRTLARKELIKRMNGAIQEAERQRWLLSPEGQEYLLKKEQDRQIALIRADLKPGQLVWKGVIVEDAIPFSEDRLGNRCSMITFIDDNNKTIDSRMLFVVIKDEKRESYIDWGNGPSKKGDIFTTNIIELEKHVSKKGNIWWRVRIV